MEERRDDEEFSTGSDQETSDAAAAKADIGGTPHDDTLEPPKPEPKPETPDDERRTDRRP